MSLVQQLSQQLSQPWYKKIPWWKICKGTMYFSFLCAVFSQCASLTILAETSSIPSLVMVGKDKILVDSNEIPEEEKQVRFVTDAMELFWDSSNKLPVELDEQCKKPNKRECQERSIPGVKVFGHTLPARQAYSSYLATVEYQPALVKTMLANNPKERGRISYYRVERVMPPKPIAEKQDTFEAVVVGAMYYRDTKTGDTWGRADNRIVQFQVIDTPSPRPKTLFQQEVSKIRKLGYQVSLVKPIL